MKLLIDVEIQKILMHFDLSLLIKNSDEMYKIQNQKSDLSNIYEANLKIKNIKKELIY